MNTSNLLTLLGFVIASSQYASANHIYPEIANPISGIGTIVFGVLAKGVGKS
jgi:hypothetical protein